MPLPTPKLDDRHFQDIVDEAKKKIPHYCKEWTDHNVSDPGVTLIELFAWMTDILLYRLNKVPDLHFIKFMDMMGVRLKESQPAEVPVTFFLSAPQNTEITIPKGTEVSSTQTETVNPIIFSTRKDLMVQVPNLKKIFSRITSSKSQKKGMVEQNVRRLTSGFEGFEIFTQIPQIDDALYFGFANDLSNHVLGFDMDFDPAGGAGIDPTMPPYIWEASTGEKDQHWAPCDTESDTTKGMNSEGRIQIHVPKMGKYKVQEDNLFWVRVRIENISDEDKQAGARPYRLSPKLRKVQVASWGGTTPATHSRTIVDEFLGQSDGTPGQKWYLKYTPVLPREDEDLLVVQKEGQPEETWTEVNDFTDSWASDNHYILDSTSGEIRFGPAIRQQDGTIKMYGAIPPRGSNIIMRKYRYGGGQIGNIQPGILNTLKTAIPYINRITNRKEAYGGLDHESLEAAMMRMPALLRSRERAVTESDFEFLAQEALPANIGRVKCLQPTYEEASGVIPGQVYLLVIPRITRKEGFLSPKQLELEKDDIKKLTEHLNDRRLLTTRLDIRPPAYQWVSVKVQLRAAPGTDLQELETTVLSKLYRFLNPLTGGAKEKGWEFGRDLFASDVYQCLQGIPNVQFIRSMELFQAKPGDGPQGSPVETIEVVAHGVIASGRHSIDFI